jgi:MerR family mercuric resistance operon transcriptional regulator
MVALQHLAEVRRKIADLRRMGRTLAEVVGQCAWAQAPECPIIDALMAQPQDGDRTKALVGRRARNFGR